MLNALASLLCLILCRHNRRRPTPVNEWEGSTACKSKLCVPQTQLSFQESAILINAHKLRTDRWTDGFLTSYTYVLDSPSMHIAIKLQHIGNRLLCSQCVNVWGSLAV